MSESVHQLVNILFLEKKIKVRNTESTKYKKLYATPKEERKKDNPKYLVIFFSFTKSRELKTTVKTEPYVSLMQFINIYFWFHCLFW